MTFGIYFRANLVPFWLDFCVLGVSWAALGPSWGRLGDVRGRLVASTRGLNFLNAFGIDFLMILMSFWEPSSAWLGPRWRPKSAKNLTGGFPERVPEPSRNASATTFAGFLMVLIFLNFWSPGES